VLGLDEALKQVPAHRGGIEGLLGNTRLIARVGCVEMVKDSDREPVVVYAHMSVYNLLLSMWVMLQRGTGTMTSGGATVHKHQPRKQVRDPPTEVSLF